MALGGQGRYAAARSVLRPLRHASDTAIRSLAASTEGSLWRQLGWHRLAAGHDGRALAVIGIDGGSSSLGVDAAADALIGLAADSLGAGRADRADTVLTRCEEFLDRVEPSWRPRVRLQWVRAEVALAQGRASDAVHHAETSASLSRLQPSVRHVVKSELLVAVAHMASGRTQDAAREVRSISERAQRHGLVPLAWASSMVGIALALEGANGDRDRFSTTIRQRGGVFRSE